MEVYTIHEKIKPSQSPLTVVDCVASISRSWQVRISGAPAWHNSIWWNDRSGEAVRAVMAVMAAVTEFNLSDSDCVEGGVGRVTVEARGNY